MKDLTIALENCPGALAEMGEALGRAGISIEGGGAWVVANGRGVAHFLVEDEAGARRALEAAGIQIVEERPVLAQRLNQNEPGQLGKISRRMARAGVNIEAIYSDHDHRLILVVDDMARGRAVSEAWTREPTSNDLLDRGVIEHCAQGANVKQHRYEVQVDWTGNDGEGTKSYKGYRRDHSIVGAGKAPISGSSDPSFRGDRSRYNPEELLVGSLSACHMLWYMHLCAVNHVVVQEYHDPASGVMRENEDGSGEFVQVVLKPIVKISPDSDREKALALHHDAHRLCFIARSVNFPVEVMPEIVGASVARPA